MLQTSANGQFGTLTQKNRNKKSATFSIEEFNYLALKDKRMRFNNSKDPIYFVFDCIEDRPLPILAREFVKDSFKDIANFVSRVVA